MRVFWQMASLFAQRSIYLKVFGFSLLEISTCIFLTGIILLSIIYPLKSRLCNLQYQNIFTEIKNVMLYAKHYAINNDTSVVICGSNDLKHCSNSWNDGYIVYDKFNKKILKSYKFLAKKTSFDLNLFAFGKTSYYGKVFRLIINNDGTTENNGHFIYLAKNKISHNLYWNKQLRFRN